MEPRLRGSHRDPERRGGVGKRQAQVVVEDDDRSMLGIEAADAALEVITIGRRGLTVTDRMGHDLRELDLDPAPLDGPKLVAARVQEQPVEPGLEAVRIPQGRQVPPASDHRLLDGVLRAVGIPKDEAGGGVEPSHAGASEHGEGVMITLLRPLHEVPLHAVRLGYGAAILVALEAYGGNGARRVPESSSRSNDGSSGSRSRSPSGCSSSIAPSRAAGERWKSRTHRRSSDGLLAATPLVHDLTLVTWNMWHVEHTGVRTLDPFSPTGPP